jgi:hypothetical protein
VAAQIAGVALVAVAGWLVAPALGLALGGIGLVMAGALAEARQIDQARLEIVRRRDGRG